MIGSCLVERETLATMLDIQDKEEVELYSELGEKNHSSKVRECWGHV